MPVQSCSVGGSPGWKWGNAGHCYTYATGNSAASGKAKQKAYLQGYAMGDPEVRKAELVLDDDDLLILHYDLHQMDNAGDDVLHQHAEVAVAMEKRGFEHLFYTDLDYRTELLLKAELTSGDLGTMGSGDGVIAPQQGGLQVASGERRSVVRAKRKKRRLVAAVASLYKRYIDAAARRSIPAEDYVDSTGRRFPIQRPEDITAAMHAYGLAKPMVPLQQFHRRLVAIARRKGQAFVDELPKSLLKAGMQKSEYIALPSVEVAKYSVLSKSNAKRFTLGVFYPVDDTDSQGEYADADTVEQAAWYYMTNGAQAGYMHVTDASGSKIGDVVESYIYRNPEPWKLTDAKGQQQLVKQGDWIGGVIWTPTIWTAILGGHLNGISIHGSKVMDEALA